MNELMQAIEKDLPPLPSVAMEAMTLVEDPDSRARDLAELISQDQALASRVLKIVNSAFYGMRGPVDSVTRAVVTLGWGEVHSLVLTAACQAMHTSASFSDQLLWDHALAVSQVARKLAVKCRFPRLVEASTAGLLHDLGKIVMDRHLGERYQVVVDLVGQKDTSFLEAEQILLDYDHAQVGGMIVESWKLSPALVEAVRWHHDPKSAETEPTLCAVVSLANSICVQQGVGLESFPDLDLSALDATEMLGLGKEELAELIEDILFEAA